MGQASRADEADRAYDEGGVDALWGITAELMDHETLTVAQIRAEAERQRASLAARPAVVQPAQPNDDGLRNRVEALVSEVPNIKPNWEFERGALRGIEMSKTAMKHALNNTSGDQQDGVQ